MLTADTLSVFIYVDCRHIVSVYSMLTADTLSVFIYVDCRHIVSVYSMLTADTLSVSVLLHSPKIQIVQWDLLYLK